MSPKPLKSAHKLKSLQFPKKQTIDALQQENRYKYPV
jgi:hypothetical protein